MKEESAKLKCFIRGVKSSLLWLCQSLLWYFFQWKSFSWYNSCKSKSEGVYEWLCGDHYMVTGLSIFYQRLLLVSVRFCVVVQYVSIHVSDMSIPRILASIGFLRISYESSLNVF